MDPLSEGTKPSSSPKPAEAAPPIWISLVWPISNFNLDVEIFGPNFLIFSEFYELEKIVKTVIFQI